MKLLMLIILFIPFVVMAEKAEMDDYRKPNYLVDSKLRAGEFLMYDCRQAVFVCVDSETFDLCDNSRKDAIARKKSSYPCAPLKRFSNKRECLYKNYEMSLGQKMIQFCKSKD